MFLSIVFAQRLNNPLLGNLGSMNGVDFIGKLIPALITLVLMVGAIVFVFMLLWGGVEYIMSGGDKNKSEDARERITNALIGLAILFSVFAIVSLVQIFFGIQITSFDLSLLKIGGACTGTPPQCTTSTYLHCDNGAWACY